MANSVFVEINTTQAAADLEARLQALYPPEAKKAINRAINHTLAIANTAASKAIRSVYNISASDLNDKSVKMVSRSSEGTLTGSINASVAPLSLSKFSPTWTRDRVAGNRSFLTSTKKGSTKKVKRGNTGVKVQIIKGRTVSLPSAFLLFNSGGSPVMARGQYGSDGFDWGQSRKPIGKLNTKSVYYALFNVDIQNELKGIIEERYPKRLLYELEKGLNYNNPNR
jgi:hypothetical protein